MQHLLTITIQSVHFYLLDFGKTKLLVDTGWPGTLSKLNRELKQLDIAPHSISYVMATHFHPDHGGLVQEIKRAFGTRLILHECQLQGIEELRAFYARKGGTGFQPVEIEKGDLLLKTADDHRSALHAVGIQASVIETPGHSSDSITLLCDNGQAFTGDLHLPDYCTEETRQLVCQSWKKLLDRNASLFYPAHANPFQADLVREQLRRCL